MDAITFGEKLKRAREAQGLSISSLAKCAKIDRTNLNAIELGKVNPEKIEIGTMKKILAALGLKNLSELEWL